MGNLFLDTNILIDLLEKRPNFTPDSIHAHDVFISPLSVHILLYVTKRKVPHEIVSKMLKNFYLVPLDKSISSQSLQGPTSDFEDNVQLHSAAIAECDYFLTSDKQLLDMKFFGKTKLVPNLNHA